MAQLDTTTVSSLAATPHSGRALSPARVRQWQLVQRLSEGPLSEIYLARPESHGRPAPALYAVKVLKAEWAEHAQAVAMLRREAQVGRAVSHPHLVSILSASVNQPPYYVVMPRLSGQTLASRLAEQNRVPVAEALWIARQVAEALDALFRAGWMHGDIKPSNIFLSPENHVTLLDLGFAQPIDRAESAATQCLTGTWNYMAPERFSTAWPVDIRSDIYSLGVVLYEMLVGRPPFSGTSAEQLARQHREARIRGLEELDARLPPDGGCLLRHMLAKLPLRRPQTPRELVDRLVRLEVLALAQEHRATSPAPEATGE